MPLSGGSPRSAAPVQPRRTSTKVRIVQGTTAANSTLCGYHHPMRFSTQQTQSTCVHALASMQVVHFMRHGITEMNVYLSKNPYKSWGFKDPLL